MQVEIFYNNGKADVLPIVGLSHKEDARTLSRQMSQCALIYSIRLRDDEDQTEDFRNGVSEFEV